MRKLSLRPDDLRVESFHVDDGRAAYRGTVHGQAQGTVGFGCTDVTFQLSCVETDCCPTTGFTDERGCAVTADPCCQGTREAGCSATCP